MTPNTFSLSYVYHIFEQAGSYFRKCIEKSPIYKMYNVEWFHCYLDQIHVLKWLL